MKKRREEEASTLEQEAAQLLRKIAKFYPEFVQTVQETVMKKPLDRCAITAAHTKNPAGWWTTWATHKRVFARLAIWAALDGDVKDLADRLRKGRASPDEMAFAADLIEGKVKPRRRKKGDLTRDDSEAIAKAAIFMRAVLGSAFKKANYRSGCRHVWPKG